MSGYTDFIEKGIDLLHRGEVKTVKDYYFISDGGHNSDLIVIKFTDGTNTKKEGFSEIEELKMCAFDEDRICKKSCVSFVEKELFYGKWHNWCGRGSFDMGER